MSSSQQRGWLKNNIPTVVLVLISLLGLAESRGNIKTKLEGKIDAEQARKIIRATLRDHAFSLKAGVILKTKHEDLKEDFIQVKQDINSEFGEIKKEFKEIRIELKEIKEIAQDIASNSEIKQRSRTTANKERKHNVPTIAFPPFESSGDEYKPIGTLDRFRLNR